MFNKIFPVRLRIVLFGLLTLGTVLFTVVQLFFYSASVEKRELNALEDLGEAVSGSAILTIVDLLLEEDYAGLDEICLGYAGNPLVTRAYVKTVDGKIVADSRAESLGQVAKKVPEGLLSGTRQYGMAHFENYLLFTRVVTFSGDTFGYVCLHISTENMSLHIRQSFRDALLTGGFLCGLGLLCSWFFSFLLIRPLEQMTSLVMEFSRGSGEKKVEPSGILEIHNLSSAFQLMKEKIENREQELRASEKKYKDIFDNALEGIFQGDADGNFITVNQRMAALFCYGSPEEFIREVGGFNEKFLVNMEDKLHLLSLLKKNGEVVQYELQLREKGGGKIWGSLNIRALYDRDGLVTYFEGSLEDISPQKESAEILADERERLGVTLRSIGDGVIATDRKGFVTLINRAGEEMTGWPLEEARGMPLEEVLRLVNGRNGEPCANPVEKAVSTGKIVEMAEHTILIARNGSRKFIADSGAPLRDKDSNIIGAVLVFRDVTNLLNMEQEQLKLKKLESLGTLAGGIAHDFNNILAAIVGNISLAMRHQYDEKALRNLEAANEAALRARDLTTQLLTFAKGGTPVKESASIGELVRGVADFVLHGSNVSCIYKIPEDVWLVEIDKGQISQVIQNLVINADHAMPDGGDLYIVCQNVAVDAISDDFPKVSDKYVRICVIDSGTGIPTNIVERIFDPYFSTKKEGSGLGLAICHSILSKHDGHISVDSMLGAGTTFSLFLPASKKQQMDIEGEVEEQNRPLRTKARIMVMDDDVMIRDIAREMLESLGHEVIDVCDGEEALSTFIMQREGGKAVDLTVMDLTIPGGMGGKEAVKKMLEIDKDAKVIVSSGYSNDPVMANFQQYGFVAAISKPYLLKDFVSAIARCLEAENVS